MTETPDNRRPLKSRGTGWAQGLASGLAKAGDVGRVPVFLSLPKLVGDTFRRPLDYLEEEFALCGDGLRDTLDQAGASNFGSDFSAGLSDVRTQHTRRRGESGHAAQRTVARRHPADFIT